MRPGVFVGPVSPTSTQPVDKKGSPYSITERRVQSWSRFLAVSLRARVDNVVRGLLTVYAMDLVSTGYIQHVRSASACNRAEWTYRCLEKSWDIDAG